jgi:biopolymer transport protein ExbB
MNQTSLFELFRLGGIFMWPLLAFSVAAFAIIIDRAVFLLRHNLRIDKIEPAAADFFDGGKFEDAADYLVPLAEKNMGARVLAALAKNARLFVQGKLGEERLEKTAETEAQTCINSLEAGFTFLTAIGSLAPLTGFLGTVSGMIGAFRSISEAVEVNAQIVANGIYEALITTVFGLIIAIVAMTAHYILSSAVDRFAVRTELACSELITALAKRKNADDFTDAEISAE